MEESTANLLDKVTTFFVKAKEFLDKRPVLSYGLIGFVVGVVLF